MHDIRFALRLWLKNPGFTFVAIATLAIGIGANTTVFSTVGAMFLQPLPVKEPDQLVMVVQKSAVWNMLHGHSWLDYLDYRQRADAFSGVLASMLNPAHLSVPGQTPERAWVEAVSGNYFSLLGVEPKLGRLIRRDEGEAAGSDPIIVLSHRYWQTKFGGNPSVIGQTMTLNGHPFTIVGVAPETFHSVQWAVAPAAFVPASMLSQVRPGGEYLLRERGAEGAFKIIARLKPGVTLAQARASVAIVAQSLRRDFPEQHRDARVFVFRERFCRPEPAFSEVMPLVGSVFMGLVLLVLLIACANVANLMFSRALVRQKELGIRAAIGATRWRLLRQLLVEGIMLGLAAGAAGCALAFWSADLLAGFNPAGDVPVNFERHWDWRVFAFTFAVSVLAGVLTAIAPAWRATRIDVQTTLKESGAALLGSGRHLFRGALVVSQVAICMIVLIGGGLLVRSLQQAAQLDLGFRADHLLLASLDLSMQGYDEPRQKQFYRELTERVKVLPGVRSVTLARVVPFDQGFDVGLVAAEENAGDKNNFTSANINRVDPDYLSTLGVTLLRGRNFTAQDSEGSTKVAVVNAFMAEKLWPGQDPLGKRFRWNDNSDPWQVVGVTRNGKYVMIGEEPRPFFYVPLAQNHAAPITLHVWTAGDPAALTPAVREALKQMDPRLPLYNVGTMEQHLHDSVFAMMPLRIGAALAGVLGLLGLLLAVMGIYGVVSYCVSQRTREIGMRLALGAPKLEIFRLVIRDGLKLTLIGLAIGLIGGLGLTGLFRKVLYGLNPAATPVFAGVVLLLGAVALLACYLPARRAAKVDPMVALRYE